MVPMRCGDILVYRSHRLPATNSLPSHLAWERWWSTHGAVPWSTPCIQSWQNCVAGLMTPLSSNGWFNIGICQTSGLLPLCKSCLCARTGPGMQSLVAVQQVLVSDQPKLAVLSGSAMKFMWFFICMLGHLAMDIGTQQTKLCA